MKIRRLLKKYQCYEVDERIDEAEKIFFLALCNAFKGTSLLIMTKVRLVDFIRVSPEIKKRYDISLLQHVLLWRCEFVVVNSQDFSVKAIVELDIKPYPSYENKQKNMLFNIIISLTGIPLLRPRSVKQVDNVATAILKMMMK
ncbi:TPA: DUF2726 domain-containing protein [Escherichia coli]|uniref:DUF2726 domain-containing protein n=1 Tax=Escherichia coli TaxID=562 RepID=UPI000E2C81BE|nr:DUF2726 domain-containing protein [Escherichia coli]RDQ06197.1 hypothetical protein C4A39_03581 [Escherichia coli]RDQ59653.1 hypothetical protein C4A28_03555 [Escherichia coli]